MDADSTVRQCKALNFHGRASARPTSPKNCHFIGIFSRFVPSVIRWGNFMFLPPFYPAMIDGRFHKPCSNFA
jgi:hypothetical protein